MHYKNGREVKIGDRVVGRHNDLPKVGIVVELLPASDSCNMALVPVPDYMSCGYQSKDFLHVDDALPKEVV